MTQNVLKVAACLGAKFSISVLTTIMDNVSPVEMKRLSSTAEKESESDDDTSIVDLNTSMHDLEEHGLLEKEKDDDQVWCFSHDKIQSAAFNLIYASKRDIFRGNIGHVLLEHLDQDELESSLFEVVSLCNCAMATISDKTERKELASLNLRAGIKATNNASFDSAAIYFKAGHKLLGSSGWEIDSPTMLKLCSEGANACYICGELDLCNTFIDEVMCQDIPIIDKYRVYEVKIQACDSAGRLHEAFNTGLEFRRLLLGSRGSRLRNRPANTFTIIKEFLKINHVLKNMTAEELANLPELSPVKDQRIIMDQEILRLMVPSVYSVSTIFLREFLRKLGLS